MISRAWGKRRRTSAIAGSAMTASPSQFGDNTSSRRTDVESLVIVR
jgi:hypothetical protein